MQRLIDKETSVSVRNEYGQTPLDCASENGYVAVVRLLINNATEVSAINEYGGNLYAWLPSTDII